MTSKKKMSAVKKTATLTGACLAVLGAGAVSSGCTHAMPLDPGQASTMSPEAAAMIRDMKVSNLPDSVVNGFITRDRIKKMRTDFDASEVKTEEALVARYHLTVTPSVIAGVPVLTITPATLRPGNEGALALNVHGGGFIMGTARDRTALLTAGELGIPVVSVGYALAPEAVYPKALNEVDTVYKTLVTTHDPDRIVAVSSSAGGSILLATLLAAQKDHLPMPRALGLFTPAADISGAGDSPVSNLTRDVIPASASLKIASFYIGDASPRDPGLSPIYGTYTSTFPPAIITTGTRDALLSNSIRLYWKLRAADVPATLVVGEGMWDGFNWEPDMPEAKAARKEVYDFLYEKLGSAAAAKTGASKNE